MREGDVSLLDEVWRERATDGMQEGWGYEPAHDRGDERREDQQDDQNAEQASHLEKNTQKMWCWFTSNGGGPVEQTYERNRTSSRWNIFTARKSAAAA